MYSKKPGSDWRSQSIKIDNTPIIISSSLQQHCCIDSKDDLILGSTAPAWSAIYLYMNNSNCTTLDIVAGERGARDDMGRTIDDGEMFAKGKVSWGYQGTALWYFQLKTTKT